MSITPHHSEYDYLLWDSNNMILENFNDQENSIHLNNHYNSHQPMSLMFSQDVVNPNDVDFSTLFDICTNNVHDEYTITGINSFNNDNFSLNPSVLSFMNNYPNMQLPSSSHLGQTGVYAHTTTDVIINTAISAVSNTSHATDTDEMSKLLMMPWITSTSTNPCPYPPTPTSSDLIDEHDRPYSKYGHLNHETICHMCQFDLIGTKTIQKRQLNKIRMSRQMYAIICHTDILREQIMIEINQQFPATILQYACISMDYSQLMTTFRTIYVQIILKKVMNKSGWFLDKVTGDKCNYHVTDNDLAWNEYIKQDRLFIETGLFKSKRARSHACHWSSSAFVRAQKEKQKKSNSSIPSLQ